MSNSDVLYHERNLASHVVINRPDVHNAVARVTLEALLAGIRRAEDARTAAIVITGAGTAAFCAGGDIEEMANLSSAAAREYLLRFANVLDAIRLSRKPVIARVDGYCLGGGNEIAMTCDLVAASERSVFSLAGLTIGAAPVLAATQLLPRTVGEKKAREVVLLSGRYSAREAAEMGWINCAVAPEALDATVESWCNRIATLSPSAVRIAKTSLNAGSGQLQGAREHGIEMLAQLFGTDEMREGTRAFLEKRPPDFARFR